MLFAFLYFCLRLILDLAVVRLGTKDSEAEVLLLRHQLRVLRREVKRPRFEPRDRAIISALGRLVARSALAGMLVRPETVLGWHRELARRKWAAFGQRRGAGRPRLDPETQQLILRMATANPRWGCVRIRGELIKVGRRVSATAIRNLLRRNRIGPAPARSRLTWTSFLRAQASAIVVTDFFSVDTVFLQRLYVLAYMELASRRLLWFAVTDRPDAGWVTQQARNLVWELKEGGSEVRFLIRDNDQKFGGGSDTVLEAEAIEVIRTPIASPRANSFMERQIGATRRECLDWILITGQRHLERVLHEWADHYNQARPHRGLGLQTPMPRSDPVPTEGQIICEERLGGLLRDYRRLPTAA